MIKIEKPDSTQLEKLGVSGWPIWEKEESEFPWHYDATEICYILEGKVTVITSSGEKAEIRKGDLVTFPQGMDCTWQISSHIRKHYNFV